MRYVDRDRSRWWAVVAAAALAGCGGGGKREAAAPAPDEEAALAPDPEPVVVYANLEDGGAWSWASSQGEIAGTVRWIAGETEDDDWIIAVELRRGDQVLWSCGDGACDLGCDAAQQRCDLAVVFRVDAMIIASMSMNKARNIPDAVWRFQWQGDALVPTAIDGCEITDSGLWEEYCSFQ